MKPLDVDAVKRWRKSHELVNELVLAEARNRTPAQCLTGLEGQLRLRATLAVPARDPDDLSFSYAWSSAKEKISGRKGTC